MRQRSYQDAKKEANELVKKLSGYDWFIGIVIAPFGSFDFIVCSKMGNSHDVVESIRRALDANFVDNNPLGVCGDSPVRLLPEGGEFAQKFYDKWLKRPGGCSGKRG